MIDSGAATTTYPVLDKDPYQVQQYRLSNGLQLLLSVNRDEPRVFTNIAFRAGSKYDPADTTGLAHYMEHMLFKGTSRIGTTDWEKEKVYLQQIADLFEVYRRETDPARRNELYRDIDRLSNEAAQLVAPNEYDQLMTMLGAKHTNAYTWVEQTVYVNDIPANELERWMRLESERFRAIALRLFHTELETVYEEFNISQDNDFRKVFRAMREELFPNHPYGTQTTIGSPEHLKNPSMHEIQRFFETWYVPNNMALVLAGDFDPVQVVQWAERYFGTKTAKNLPDFSYDEQPELSATVRREVLGREAAYVQLGWRIGPGSSDDGLMAVLVSHLLHNDQAGLIDEELLQKQEVLAAESWTWLMEDFSAIGLYGKPRDGQTLEEVEQLLIEQVERLRTGDFAEWLIEACIKDMKVADVRAQVNNQSRVGAMTNAYLLGLNWQRYVDRFEWLNQLTKADITDWASRHLPTDRYVVTYKRTGDDPDVIKVDKPPLTPVQLNREATSTFAQELMREQAPRLAPVFAEFEQRIEHIPLREGVSLDYVRNTNNALFNFDIIFEMGRNHDPLLPLALDYLPFLHTPRYSAKAWQRELFRLGLSLDTYCYNERTYLSLSGLDESMVEGVQLLVHLLEHCQPDAVAWQAVVVDTLQKRDNSKQNRQTILRDGLGNYARYGTESPWRNRVDAATLHRTEPEALVERLGALTSFQHRIHYYGPQEPSRVEQVLEQYYPLPTSARPPLAGRTFQQLPTTANEVLYTHFPMVQTDLMLMSRGTPQFSLEEYIMKELYNDYFGYGLSSIFFQAIREARALAYSTYAYYSSPKRRDQAHYLSAYIGTQPDKMDEALTAATDLLQNMPLIDDMVDQARLSLVKRIESDRIPERKLYWEAQRVRDLGYRHDLLRDIYDRMLHLQPQELADFHAQYVQHRPYKLLVLGDRDAIPHAVMEAYGPVRELSIEELFGF